MLGAFLKLLFVNGIHTWFWGSNFVFTLLNVISLDVHRQYFYDMAHARQCIRVLPISLPLLSRGDGSLGCTFKLVSRPHGSYRM